MSIGLPLHTLTYTELRLITEGKISEAKRLHVRGHDILMHRSETAPIPYAYWHVTGPSVAVRRRR